MSISTVKYHTTHFIHSALARTTILVWSTMQKFCSYIKILYVYYINCSFLISVALSYIIEFLGLQELTYCFQTPKKQISQYPRMIYLIFPKNAPVN